MISFPALVEFAMTGYPTDSIFKKSYCNPLIYEIYLFEKEKS